MSRGRIQKESWATWKKIVFAVACFLVLTRTFYIVFRGEADRQYTITPVVGMADASFVPCVEISQQFTFPEKILNSVELMFNGIEEQASGAVVMRIEKQGELLYQANISLAAVKNMEWRRIYVNLPVDKDVEYTIHLDATDACSSPPEILTADGQVAIQYGYLSPLGVIDVFLQCLLWAVLLVVCYFILTFWEKIRIWLRGLLRFVVANFIPKAWGGDIPF